MVSFTLVVTTAAALAGQALGQPENVPMPLTCNVGETYCGFHLLNNGNSMLPPPSLPLHKYSSHEQRTKARETSPNKRKRRKKRLTAKTAYNFWFEEMRKAQPGLEEGRRSQALYRCQAGVDRLEYVDYCPRIGQRCEPNSSGLCGPATPFPNDCCASR